MFLSTAQMRRVFKPQHDIHLRIFNEDVYRWRRWIHVRPTSLRTKGEFFPGRAQLEEVVQMPVEITECGFEFLPAGQAYFYCAQNWVELRVECVNQKTSTVNPECAAAVSFSFKPEMMKVVALYRGSPASLEKEM
ncbi:unnamed protein product [Leuciscus chuanchicus]